ncbi:putative nucleoporin [Xylona heveae TC161]|uniref:Nucleoporin NUP188 n=1 Tax=Xylona heveae (strain CBS 132557 / TC161) TaxID=1328760 RepID=A0A164ZXH8_XYLHT|nr:putative nucleoporin [Xylona heveae TC161]KZF19660.1 putative nucleoporin [Xylona heveae TC161]
MAPIGESSYFPPLDKVFSGEQPIISWKTAFTTLRDIDRAGNSSRLRAFFKDPVTIDLLSRPNGPFEKPTAQTKSSFETRTAAINVAPNAQGSYNINQIKDDALWLSKESRIDEISALRIAILEWQTRPAVHLLTGFSEEEAASVQEAAGGTTLGSSVFRPNASVIPSKSGVQAVDAADFGSDENRQLRLLKGYLSERRYVLKVSTLVLYAATPAGSTATQSHRSHQELPFWVPEAGNAVLKACGIDTEYVVEGKSSILRCIECLQERVEVLEMGSQWYKEEGGRPEMEDSWGRNQILEMIHILELIFVLLDSSPHLTSSEVLLAWFTFMAKYGFFDRLEPPFPEQRNLLPPFQSMLSIVSLAILKTPLACAKLVDSADRPRNEVLSRPTDPYLDDKTTMSQVTEILVEAAGACVEIASPAGFAWGVIFQTLRVIANSRRERWELRQSQKAADSFVASESSETEGGEPSATESGGRSYQLRRPSTASDASLAVSFYEEILEAVMDVPLDGDPISFLARSAVNVNHVFDVVLRLATQFCTPFGSEDGAGVRMRASLLDLIRTSLDFVDYLPEVIESVLACLDGGERYWDFVGSGFAPGRVDPLAIFAKDEVLVEKLFIMAKSRFPYEALPFLKLCKALAAYRATDIEGNLVVTQFLSEMGTFTQVLPPAFRGYQTSREDENANLITAVEDLDLLSSKQQNGKPSSTAPGDNTALVLAEDTAGKAGFTILPNTEGRVIAESKPLVIMWTHRYSALTYLGILLEKASHRSHDEIGSRDASAQDIITETVGLLTKLITSTAKVERDGKAGPTDGAAAKRILEEASDGLDRNHDIISVIFDIFEAELQWQQRRSGAESSLALVINCAHFIYALTSILPSRVWPFLARSRLLELDGRGGQLAALVASTEMVTGRYEFLISCIRIFDALVEDAVINSVARKETTESLTRFAASNGSGNVPDRILKRVLLGFQKIIIDVLESSPNWKFVNMTEKLEINDMIISTFRKILSYSHGIDDSADADAKITAVLASPAANLLDIFLSASPNDLPISPILRIFYDGVSTPNSTLFLVLLRRWTLQVRSALHFCVTLVRVGQLLQLPFSYLEKQLFKAAPLLVRLYAADESYRLPVVLLFEAIVTRAAFHFKEPPSLLGHLGPERAKTFLSVLSALDRPLDDIELEIAIWNLLSAVVSNRQQWFAIYLLTGSTPRESLKGKDTGAASKPSRDKPLLTVALDSLTRLHDLPPHKAIAMLEFVALAEDSWPWAMAEIQRHSGFLGAISDFAAGLAPFKALNDTKTTLNDCNQVKMASYVAEVLAMYLHHSRQLGDISFGKTLASKMNFFAENAVRNPSYNASLHSNLRRNFEKKFRSCKLQNFKRTLLQKRSFGRDYFYDLGMASKMLDFEPSWKGTNHQGFAGEVARANINMSVVESQIALLHSWKFLAVELSSILAYEPQLQETMAKVVNQCLVSNAETHLPENIFGRLVQLRAEFAFVLMQRLVEAKANSASVRAVLQNTWRAIRSFSTDFELALAGPDADYLRTLLKILFLALKIQAVSPLPSTASAPTQGLSGSPTKQDNASASPEITKTIIEILGTAVAGGFRAVATILHDNPQRSSPADLALLSAILQTALRIPGVEMIHQQLVGLFCDSRIGRYATTLYSWSDQLAIDGDPVYGELSILFLLELSSVSAMAEQLAVEGVLTHLSTANIMNYFSRPNGVGPFDEQPRLYSIWARGILPLCLNFLDAVGAAVAVEVALFLNQYPNQLARSAASFEAKSTLSTANPSTAGCITLNMASEAHSLALISFILDNFRAAGAATGVVAGIEIPELRWDKSQLKEDIDAWLQGRRALRDRIVPTTEKEMEMARQKPLSDASGAESRLEERIVADLDMALKCLNGGGVS